MAQVILNQVHEAEEKADALRRKAADEAREMVKAVQEATLEASRQAAAYHRAMYQERMQGFTAGVEKRLAAQEGERQARLNEIRSKAEENLPEASRLIVERILKHGYR